MDRQCGTIRLFSVQHKKVVDIIQKDGTCYSKEEYILNKYGESSAVFSTAYRWLAQNAVSYVQKPLKAEFPYWAFADESSFERYGDSSVLVMDVPLDQGIYFDLHDWNKIMKLQYMGKDDEEEKDFRAKIRAYGIKHDSDIMLTNFYPDLQREIKQSWQHLFYHHKEIASGAPAFQSLQAALWEIRKEWISEIIE